MKFIKHWFASRQQNADRPGPRVAASPLLLALEPRVVYDASVAAVAAQPHAGEHAHEVAHRPVETHTDTAAPAASANPPAVDKPVRSASRAASDPTSGAAAAQNQQHANAGNDISVAMPAAQTQVVFIDASVANYQTLIAGLPAGTQYVVLDANTDGLAQMAHYLQAHHGVESISLISHGSDGMIQVGSTWLTSSDLSAYSTELARIGAAMNAGGDFLIYGCDVAQHADGQALVQQIASITHLNVAASIDATGAAALGGNWTLEYQVGNVHTALNESASAVAQFNELLGVTTETYDAAANNNFQSIGQSQFTLDGVVYTMDQAANNYAYNDANAPVNPPSDLTNGPTDGVLEINADGASSMRNLTISLANGHTFSLQSFDLSSFNGDLYIQANYANGTSSALIQLATASVGGFLGTVSSQLGSAFTNVISFSLIDRNDSGSFLTSLDNLSYIDNGPTVTTSGSTTTWSSADHGAGTGGTAVAVDPGLTLSDGVSSTATSATVKIVNFQSGDLLSFTPQNGITSSYNVSTGTLTLTATGTPLLAQWQAALESVTYSSSLTSPNLVTTMRTVSFSFTDGTYSSTAATHSVHIVATDQTPVLTEGGSTSTGYLAGNAATAIDSGLQVSDADSPGLASGTVAISSGFGSDDTLAFSNTNSTLYGDITGSYNSSTHQLTLVSASGTATALQWQHAFDAVTFASSISTTGGTRDITFSVSDGTKTSALLHHSVVVTAGPNVITDSGSAAFVTGDNTTSTPVAIDPGLTVTDGNRATLVSATVAITGNFQAAHDQLLFTSNPATMGDIAGVYDASSGLLTLSSASSASLAQWQAALSSIRFTSDLVVPSSATRTISYQVNDGALSSPLASRTVTVTATDQTPLLGHGGNAAAFVAGDNTSSTPVAINPAITVTDADGGPLQSATVTITGNYESTDLLAFHNTSSALYGNIAGTYTNGVLTLTSSGSQATLAQWQAALQAVSYTSTAVTPGTGARTISFVVSDGIKSSAAASSTVTVADTDQTPVITGTAGAVTFTQGDNAVSTAVAVDAGITLSDRDNGSFTSATVTIGNFDANGDVLLFSNDGATMGNITAQYLAGTLTLSSAGGSATLAQWQSALRSIQFDDFALTPSGAARTISFTISDGTKTSTAWQRVVNVVRTDQSPILTDSGGATSFTSADNTTSTPVAVDSALTLSDLDSATMASATVSITGNYHAGEDVLALGSGSFGDITATFNSSTGTLTLTSAGASTIAQWQAALRSVTYTDTAAVPQTNSRTITFSVNDGTKPSNASSKLVTVTATPQTPLLGGTASSVSYLPGQAAIPLDSGMTLTDRNVSNPAAQIALSITVQIGSGFQPGDHLTVGNMSSPPVYNLSYDNSTGTLTINSSGSGGTLAQWQQLLDNVEFVTGSNAPLGARSITVTVSDSVRTSQPRTYTLDVISSAPALATTSTGSVGFVAGDNVASTPVAIDPNLTVSDPLGDVVTSATVAIVGNLHSGEDVLGFVNDGVTMGNITAIYNAATGTMTLSSAGASATLAQWQAALRSVTYTDVGITPNTATRLIDISIGTGTQDSNVLQRTVTVARTDQTPLISTGSSGSVAFVAADNAPSTPVAIDNGINLADLDNATLASATVQIGAGFHAGEDVLGFVNDGATMGNITATYNAATGTLTLSSAGASATLAQWQAALRSVTYTDTAVTPSTATRSIGFTVNDGTKTSAAYSRNVTLTDTDQTPVLSTGSSGPASFLAGDNAASAPVAIDSGIVVSDLDNATLASATVRIGTGFHAGEDVLGFVNDGATMGNITATYNAATGTMTLSSAGASATLAQWQAALRAVTYTDTAASPNTATRSIDFTVNDNAKTSAVYSRNVTVTATDQTPLISTGSSGSVAFVAADNAPSTPVTIDNGITLADLDNATLASATVRIGAGFHAGEDVLGFVNDGATMGNITATYNAATGTMTLSSAGASATLAQWQAALRAVTYTDTAVTPNTATRSIGFTVNDGVKSSTTLSRNVTVADTDQTPIASTTSTGPAAFVAGDNAPSTPIAIDSNIALVDLDNPTLASATVQIGAGFHAGEDVLGFVNDGATMGNITAAYNAATGTMTLSSAGASATLAQWQAALRSVTYTDTAVTPDTASRTISFTVSDGVKTSMPLTRAVSVAATDQTPIVTSTSSGTAAFVSADNAASTPVAIDAGITLADLDNATLASATVRIGTGFHAGEDVLGFTNDGATMGNITATYNAATGTMTLSSAGASATLAQWQAALRAVTYTDTAVTPNTATRSIDFTVNDNAKTSAVYSRNVTVTATDQTPLISTGSSGSVAFVSGDNAPSTPVAVDAGITLADADNPTLASATVRIGAGFHAGEDVLGFVNDGATMGNITATYNAATGTMTLSSAGASATLAQWQAALRSVTYTDTAVTPDTATRSIGFTINDGVKSSTTLSRNVAVTATHQTLVVSASDTPLTYTADGKAATVARVGVGITLTDRNGTPPVSATVAIGAGFDPKHDLLAFNASAATGDIAASYDAGTGTLKLTSASGTATLAQWQAAITAVTYRDTQLENKAGSRTLIFTLSDGTSTSQPLTRTLQIQASQDPVGTPILPGTPAIGLEPPVGAAPPSSSRGNPLLVTDINGHSDGVSNPVIVLTELQAPNGFGAITPRTTFTFAAHGHRDASLGDTHVSALDSIVPASTEAPPAATRTLPTADVHPLQQAGSRFALPVAPLVGAPAGRESVPGAANEVAVTLAGGAPLPTWLHYDAARGVLSGTPPAGVRSVHVTLLVRDAAGNATRRDVVVRFDAPAAQRASGHARDAAQPSSRPANRPAVTDQPHAALPASKASLAAQFASAHAVLHVARSDAVPSEPRQATTERRS
ncbi:DUF4347 domain-containing protein [Burkholderia glumae]|uniref:DUF4347 domain-containing protein n=1 Tax=Burkholderia glumae TaxID=337 RepID=UPI002036E69B|nr:DUF4347 domain-containing protein [Burkholderia glumae]MCM2485194.1 DUF4347 domain-containing protein [Burkholderia glumae]MCM2510889.1 DUF4347 domain-containing protein [Burkholderia glumae]